MVVIVDMNLQTVFLGKFGEFSDSAALAGIYKNEALDFIKVEVFDLGEIEEVGGGV